MDTDRFVEIVSQCMELWREKEELDEQAREQIDSFLAGEPCGTRTQPAVFESADDLLAFEALQEGFAERRRNIHKRHRELARQAATEGYPLDYWLKVDDPSFTDGEPVAIQLCQHRQQHFQFRIEPLHMLLTSDADEQPLPTG